MHFNKIKKIFGHNDIPSGWAISHASNPTPYQISSDIWRVFFSARDKENRSHISYVDFRLPDFTIVNVADGPVISPSGPGSFDDRGCSSGCTLVHEGKLYLFYLGWNLSPDVPFQNSIGMAISKDDGKTFDKVAGPILDRSFYDPYSVSYPFIFRHGQDFKMIYGSHTQWGEQISDMIHGLKIASSSDLINWNKTTDYIIPADKDDYAFSRPWVFQENGQLRMFYCYRGKIYKIGMAEAVDENLNEWKRLDSDIDLNLSTEGWDSGMICYPSLIDYKGRRFLLYCGNNYGKEGFGLSEIIK